MKSDTLCASLSWLIHIFSLPLKLFCNIFDCFCFVCVLLSCWRFCSSSILRWPCLVDRTLKSSYSQPIPVLSFFFCLERWCVFYQVLDACFSLPPPSPPCIFGLFLLTIVADLQEWWCHSSNVILHFPPHLVCDPLIFVHQSVPLWFNCACLDFQSAVESHLEQCSSCVYS